MHNSWRQLLFVGAIMSLSGCSLFGGAGNYQQSTSAQALQMPPQLSPPKTESTYAIPPTSGLGAPSSQMTSATGTLSTQAGQAGVLPKVAGMKLEQAGPFHWLRVDAPPGVVWPKIKAYFQAHGYSFVEANPRSGVLITNWKESAHGLPKGFLGMLIKNIVASGERERYVVRLVAAQDGKATDVFLSEQGAIKAKDSQGDLVWQWQPPNPAKEATTLQALMVYMGMPKQEAKAMLAASRAPVGQLYTLAEEGGTPVLKTAQPFAIAWPQVGLGLDRANLVVEKQDRAEGIYAVKYVGESQSSPLQRLFGGGSVLNHGARFEIKVVPQGSAVLIYALNAKGKPLSAKGAREVLKQLLGSLQ